MNSTDDPIDIEAANGRGQVWKGAIAVVLILYAALLTRDIAQPWVGLHDWNGAFYSQLARNLLRYPFEVHHGMPVVAVGLAPPSPEECSIYATHPPGLAWLVAMSFRVFGEQEWSARLVPIVASLGALAILATAVRRRCGQATAVVFGVVFALLPMTAYFGRMVDQEAPALMCMAAGALALDDLLAGRPRTASRVGPGFVWAVCAAGAIFIDWSGVLFAGLAVIWATVQAARRRCGIRAWARITTPVIVAVCAMLAHLVYAGLNGRWADLYAIFLSRSGSESVSANQSAAAGGAWAYTVDNLTWPVIVLATTGLILRLLSKSETPRTFGGAEAGRSTAAAGHVILAITGVLWLGVFWRQYQRHHYWLYYLAPLVAESAAVAAVAIARSVRRIMPRWAEGVVWAAGGVTVVFAILGVNRFYDRVALPIGEVQAWRRVHERVVERWKRRYPEDEVTARVLLYRNPVRLETRGGYVLRNIVPPQMAYYLDMPFDVESNLIRAAREAGQYEGFLLSARDAIDHGGQLRAFREVYNEVPVGEWVLFEASR